MGLPSEPTGVKHDAGKLDWTLLPWSELEQVVRVLQYGAAKYSPNNWKYVSWQRYASAAIRHIVSRFKGEIRDPETGLPHLAHAVCCLIFLMWKDSHDKNDPGPSADQAGPAPEGDR